MNSCRPIIRSACRLALSVAPLIFASGHAVAAGVVEITWDASGHFNQSLTVVPGKVIEVCGKLPAAQKVQWKFESDTPLKFNVHYHTGKDVVYPSKLEAVSTAHGVLETQTEQSYCWMWSNPSHKSATITLALMR